MKNITMGAVLNREFTIAMGSTMTEIDVKINVPVAHIHRSTKTLKFNPSFTLISSSVLLKIIAQIIIIPKALKVTPYKG